jgi:hypothetical protein
MQGCDTDGRSSTKHVLNIKTSTDMLTRHRLVTASTAVVSRAKRSVSDGCGRTQHTMRDCGLVADADVSVANSIHFLQRCVSAEYWRVRSTTESSKERNACREAALRRQSFGGLAGT